MAFTAARRTGRPACRCTWGHDVRGVRRVDPVVPHELEERRPSESRDVHRARGDSGHVRVVQVHQDAAAVPPELDGVPAAEPHELRAGDQRVPAGRHGLVVEPPEKTANSAATVAAACARMTNAPGPCRCRCTRRRLPPARAPGRPTRARRQRRRGVRQGPGGAARCPLRGVHLERAPGGRVGDVARGGVGVDQPGDPVDERQERRGRATVAPASGPGWPGRTPGCPGAWTATRPRPIEVGALPERALVDRRLLARGGEPSLAGSARTVNLDSPLPLMGYQYLQSSRSQLSPPSAGAPPP